MAYAEFNNLTPVVYILLNSLCIWVRLHNDMKATNLQMTDDSRKQRHLLYVNWHL